MTKKRSPSRLTEIEQGLYKLSHKCAETLQLTSEGFNLHSRRHLNDAEKLAKEVHTTHVKLTAALLDELEAHKDELEEVKMLIPIPGHLERVGDCCESIICVTYTKIKNGTLFSDRAVTEINTLFKSTIDLIKSAGDIILTKNKLLTEHIFVETQKLSEFADNSATMHEERLILGMCNAQSAPMFLDVLDSLKGILAHLKKISEISL